MAAVRGADDGAASARPAVFVLPGILGSNLKVDGKRIWLGWRLVNGLKRLAYTAGEAGRRRARRADRIELRRPCRVPRQTHEVIEFAFDWRRPIEDEARRLAARSTRRSTRATAERPAGAHPRALDGRPGRAHDAAREARDLAAHDGARRRALPDARHAERRLVGADAGAVRRRHLRQLLAAFGAPFQDRAARALMARLPGFLQLQAALLDDQLALRKHETWQELADDDLKRVRENSWWHRQEMQIGIYSWGAPPQDVLDRAVALRRRLDAQAAWRSRAVQGQAACSSSARRASRRTATSSATTAWRISTRRTTATAA